MASQMDLVQRFSVFSVPSCSNYLFVGSRRGIAPQPAERIGQNGAAVLAVVGAVTEFETVIVLGEAQGQGHLLVGQGPVAEFVVQVLGPALQEHTDGLGLGLGAANESRIDIAAA